MSWPFTAGGCPSPLWDTNRSGRNNGTLYFWDGLIEDFRFPFLKATVVRDKRWNESMPHLRDVIERHTRYPYELIQSNVERLGRRTYALPG